MSARRYLRAAPFGRGRLVAARVFREPANGARPVNYAQRTRAHPGKILAACLGMIACANGIKVQANEASAVTGAGYVTFFVLQGNSSGSTTLDRQLRTAIETALTDKGFVEASSEEAQAVVIVPYGQSGEALPRCLLRGMGRLGLAAGRHAGAEWNRGLQSGHGGGRRVRRMDQEASVARLCVRRQDEPRQRARVRDEAHGDQDLPRNTTGIVFREPTDQELYVRVPAGWFRAWTTNGPWEPVPEDKLPADLAAIGH
jgi:hypothetical protein